MMNEGKGAIKISARNRSLTWSQTVKNIPAARNTPVIIYCRIILYLNLSNYRLFVVDNTKDPFDLMI